MKKLNLKSIHRKTLLLSLVLLVAIIGVGVTVALSVAKSNPVVNTFKAGKIDTELDETVSGLNKSVSVHNSEKADSDAFIRVRINAPDGIVLKLSENYTEYWEDGGDGFYYFLYSVAPGESTTELLSSVGIDEYATEAVKKELKKNGFDVTVYQESCIASQISHYEDEGAKPISVDNVKAAFDRATTNQTE